MNDYDACIVGSGAGGGPVALSLSQAGYNVLVLEKGPWFTESDYFKDEMACCRKSVYTPKLKDEQHVLEDYDEPDGKGGYKWKATPTSESGRDFWNGNCVGGSSSFMSGFFYRLKPDDFRLLSAFGPIKEANIQDWPISYEELEPYYTLVETEVGVSGHATRHRFSEPRSSKDFPFPPTIEHPVSARIDHACEQLGYHSLQIPRAILPYSIKGRQGCSYSGFCGSYGCATGAKGGSRAALLNRAVETRRCTIVAHAKVNRLITNNQGKLVFVEYVDQLGKVNKVSAKIYVLACQAIETSRLLLLSKGIKFPNGLANNSGQVGKNLVFSAGGSGQGDFNYAGLSRAEKQKLKLRGPFINRGLQDWYFINNKQFGRAKGGTIDFLLRHPNIISRAEEYKWGNDDKLVWGSTLKKNLHEGMTAAQTLNYEVFCDWLPTDDCFVSLDTNVKDKWGMPVAKVRLGYHDHDLKIGKFLSEKARKVLAQMGAENISGSVSGSPPQNLVAGGCRFGNDPATSVLDKDCRAHEVENLFVTDGSFMPTGGSVPYTWTIYANAFRVADKIKQQLGSKA